MEITTKIDGKVKIVTEASIRRHPKLEDSDGISNLPTTEIFEQLALMGSKKTAWEQFSSNIATAIICLATNRKFNFSKLIFDGMDERSTVLFDSHHTPTSAPSTLQPPTSPPSMQTTHVAEEAATMPHDSPLLRVHLLGSYEGSITLHELMVLCTTLSKKVESLESDLKQTKLTYGAAYTKLIMKGRKIAQLDEDEGITLVQMGAQTQGRHEHDLEPDFKFTNPEEVYTAEPDISAANVPISTAGEEVSSASPEVKTTAESLVYIRRSAAKRKDKGKAIMKEADPIQKKTKLQLEQERLGVHEEANTFNAEEWDNIQAQIEADEELAQKLQVEERGKFSKVEKVRLFVEMINERKRLFAQQRAEQRRNKPMTQAQQRTYMCNYIKNMGSHTLKQLKKLSFDEIKELFKTTMKRVKDFVPMKSDRLVPMISTGSSKRTLETELDHEGSKRQKTNEEQLAKEEKELSEEEL
ncbi:hypothetical protein Tco_0488299 [Tanacetum coccineum]